MARALSAQIWHAAGLDTTKRRNLHQRRFMLRVTETHTTDVRIWLRLEGRLVGPWVAALQDTAGKARAAGRHVHLDLAGLRYADAAGVLLLQRLVADGAILERPTPFIQELLLTPHRLQ